MEDKIVRKNGYDYVHCPLVDELIVDIDCIENRDIVDNMIQESCLPNKYKAKENWANICKNCKWHNH